MEKGSDRVQCPFCDFHSTDNQEHLGHIQAVHNVNVERYSRTADLNVLAQVLFPPTNLPQGHMAAAPLTTESEQTKVDEDTQMKETEQPVPVESGPQPTKIEEEQAVDTEMQETEQPVPAEPEPRPMNIKEVQAEDTEMQELEQPVPAELEAEPIKVEEETVALMAEERPNNQEVDQVAPETKQSPGPSPAPEVESTTVTSTLSIALPARKNLEVLWSTTPGSNRLEELRLKAIQSLNKTREVREQQSKKGCDSKGQAGGTSSTGNTSGTKPAYATSRDGMLATEKPASSFSESVKIEQTSVDPWDWPAASTKEVDPWDWPAPSAEEVRATDELWGIRTNPDGSKTMIEDREVPQMSKTVKDRRTRKTLGDRSNNKRATNTSGSKDWPREQSISRRNEKPQDKFLDDFTTAKNFTSIRAIEDHHQTPINPMKYTIGSSISSFLKENETDKAANWKFGDPLSSSKGVMPQPPSGPKSITAQNRSSNRYQKDMERREQPASPSDYEMGGPDKGSEPRGRGRYGSSRHYDVRGHEEKGYGHIDEEPRGRPRHRYSAYSTQKQEFEDPLVYDWDANPAGDKVQADYPLDEGQMMDDWRPYEGPKQQTGAGRTSGVGLPMALRCPTCCRFHMGTDCGPAPAPCIVCGGDHWVKQCNAQAKMLATTYRPGISCPECKTMHKKDCPLPGSCPICLRVHDGLCLKPSGTCRYCGGVHWENGCIRWQTLDEEMGYSAGQAEAKGVRMDMRSLVSEYYSHSYGKVVKGRDQSLPSQTPPPPKQNLPGSYQAIAAEQRSIVPTYATAKAIKRGSGARRRSRSREAKEYKESMMRGDNATGSKSPSYKRRSPTSNSGWVYAPHGRIDSDIVPGPERSLSPASIGNHRRQSSPFSRRPRSPQPPQATDSYIPGKYDDNQPDTTVPKRARDPSREPYGPGVSPPWGDLRVEFGKRRRMD